MSVPPLPQQIPDRLPETGLGDTVALALFEDLIETRSARLDAADAFAHMDPPTPALAARLVGLNAAHNQNLLHPDLSPLATAAERRLIEWLAPAFDMAAGHVCAGSTLANLAALWCAREHGARCVIASHDAHVSVAKSAHVLGLPFETLPIDDHGRAILPAEGVGDDVALVLTAGTTGRGAIDPLEHPSPRAGARWLHVDAAWAGPLRLTRHAGLLDGIERADSVALSAHKWFYQPKDSALVLFRSEDAEAAISFGGAYLAVPNVGVQGSRGAAAIPLLATLLAWGRSGLAARIEKNMADATALADVLEADPRTVLKQRPDTAVLNWRPADRALDIERLLARLGHTSSRNAIDGAVWVRQVAANPHADVAAIRDAIDRALSASCAAVPVDGARRDPPADRAARALDTKYVHGDVPVVAFVARADAEETDGWIDALQIALPAARIVPIAALTPAERASVRVAIVADPDPAELQALPSLVWVQSLWAGVERLVAELGDGDVAIARLVDPRLAETMAEAVLTWTLWLHRDGPAYLEQQRERVWRQRAVVRPPERVVGVLGLGALGTGCAARLANNGFDVRGWSRSPRAAVDLPPGVLAVDGEDGLRELLAASDILVILLPLTAATTGLLDAERLAHLKPGACLINAARGAIVDARALVHALDAHRVGHAVLDVFEVEPLPVDDPLWSHPRVTVLPHVTAPTDRRTASAIAAGNVRRFLVDGTLPEVVDVARGY